MEDATIDYSRFSREDLESALASIDREKYPGSYRALLAAIRACEERKSPEERGAGLRQSIATAIGEPMPDVRMDRPGEFSPVGKPEAIAAYRKKFGAFALAPIVVAVVFCIVSLFHPGSPASGAGGACFTVALLLFGSGLLLHESSYAFHADALIVRSGFGALSSHRTFPRESIRLVIWVETERYDSDSPGNRSKSWHLELRGGDRISRLELDDPAHARWMGQEIARWAQAQYYRRRDSIADPG